MDAPDEERSPTLKIVLTDRGGGGGKPPPIRDTPVFWMKVLRFNCPTDFPEFVETPLICINAIKQTIVACANFQGERKQKCTVGGGAVTCRPLPR